MGVNIKLTNRLTYTLISFGILAFLAIVINAVAPNPGHDSTQLDLDPLFIVPPNQINILANGGNPFLILGDSISNGQYSFFLWDSVNNLLKIRVTSGITTWSEFVMLSSGKFGVNTTTPTTALDVTGDIHATGDASVDGAFIAQGGLVWTSTNDGPGSGLNADQLDGLEDGELNAKYVAGSEIKVITGSPNPRICVKDLGCTSNPSASCTSYGSDSSKTGCSFDPDCTSFCNNRITSNTCTWNCNGNIPQCSLGGTSTSGTETCVTVNSALCEQISGFGHCFCTFRGSTTHTYVQEILGTAWFCTDTIVE